MGEFDEYDFLQDGDRPAAQDQTPANGKPAAAEIPRDRDRDRRDKDRPREERHRSRHRSRSREHRSHSHRSSRPDDRHDRERRAPREHREHRGGRHDERDHGARSRGYERPLPPPPASAREQTPPEIRAAREREKELAELDRDIRTVFAHNLPLRAGEEDLLEFFAQAGTVLDVKIITDRNTRRSKGFAYIEYARREDIVNALALTGQTLMGQTVMVKSSEAEKNMAWEAQQQQAQAQAQLNALQSQQGTGPCKLLVANINIRIEEDDLRNLFMPFGTIISVEVVRDSTGAPQGYGYVEFTTMADAAKAMQQWDGQELVGQKLSVKIQTIAAPQQLPGMQPAVDLDERDEQGGLKLTSNARAALMSRLAGENVAGSGSNMVPMGQQPPGPSRQLPMPPQEPQIQWTNPNIVMEQGMLGPKSPIPTQCLLLKNMFDPAAEEEPSWDQDIAGDVKDECSKYGAVGHIHVDRNSKGHVYLKFLRPEGASAAQKSLNGRWFAGRQISADFQFPAVYNNHFKC